MANYELKSVKAFEFHGRKLVAELLLEVVVKLQDMTPEPIVLSINVSHRDDTGEVDTVTLIVEDA